MARISYLEEVIGEELDPREKKLLSLEWIRKLNQAEQVALHEKLSKQGFALIELGRSENKEQGVERDPGRACKVVFDSIDPAVFEQVVLRFQEYLQENDAGFIFRVNPGDSASIVAMLEPGSHSSADLKLGIRQFYEEHIKELIAQGNEGEEKKAAVAFFISDEPEQTLGVYQLGRKYVVDAGGARGLTILSWAEKQWRLLQSGRKTEGVFNVISESTHAIVTNGKAVDHTVTAVVRSHKTPELAYVTSVKKGKKLPPPVRTVDSHTPEGFYRAPLNFLKKFAPKALDSDSNPLKEELEGEFVKIKLDLTGMTKTIADIASTQGEKEAGLVGQLTARALVDTFKRIQDQELLSDDISDDIVFGLEGDALNLFVFQSDKNTIATAKSLLSLVRAFGEFFPFSLLNQANALGIKDYLNLNDLGLKIVVSSDAFADTSAKDFSLSVYPGSVFSIGGSPRAEVEESAEKLAKVGGGTFSFISSQEVSADGLVQLGLDPNKVAVNEYDDSDTGEKKFFYSARLFTPLIERLVLSQVGTLVESLQNDTQHFENTTKLASIFDSAKRQILTLSNESFYLDQTKDVDSTSISLGCIVFVCAELTKNIFHMLAEPKLEHVEAVVRLIYTQERFGQFSRKWITKLVTDFLNGKLDDTSLTERSRKILQIAKGFQ